MDDGAVASEYVHRIEKLEIKLEALDIAIRGNNKKGLITRMELLESRVEAIYKLLWFVAFTSSGLVIKALVELVIA